MPWLQPGDLVIFYSAGNLEYMLGCVKDAWIGYYIITRSEGRFSSFWHVLERDIILKIGSA